MLKAAVIAVTVRRRVEAEAWRGEDSLCAVVEVAESKIQGGRRTEHCEPPSRGPDLLAWRARVRVDQ